MKIIIKDKQIIISDEKGNAVSMTTTQLIEMMRILNISTNKDGGFIFSLLEFTF